MPDELKPIGAEFEWWAAPDTTCSNLRWRVFTYRVIAHDKVQGGMAERIEAIAVKEYPATEWMHLGDRFIPVPPAEMRHMVPGWNRFGDYIFDKPGWRRH